MSCDEKKPLLVTAPSTTSQTAAETRRPANSTSGTALQQASPGAQATETPPNSTTTSSTALQQAPPAHRATETPPNSTNTARQQTSPPAPADLEATFWFVWMVVLLAYTTFSAIAGSVKWLLVSCIASDIFTVLSALLWIFVAIDFALNIHWMIDETINDERSKKCKIYSRRIRIHMAACYMVLCLN